MNPVHLGKTLFLLSLAGAALFSGAASADPDFYGSGFRSCEPHWPVWGRSWGPAWNDSHGSRFEDAIDARQERQQRRIEQGIRTGELTPEEARRLVHEQRHISRLERHFRADGWLDAYERNVLDRELDDAGRHILREKHDADWR